MATRCDVLQIGKFFNEIEGGYFNEIVGEYFNETDLLRDYIECKETEGRLAQESVTNAAKYYSAGEDVDLHGKIPGISVVKSEKPKSGNFGLKVYPSSPSVVLASRSGLTVLYPSLYTDESANDERSTPNLFCDETKAHSKAIFGRLMAVSKEQEPFIDLNEHKAKKQDSVGLNKLETKKQDSSIVHKKHETEKQDPSISLKKDEIEKQDPSIDLKQDDTEKQDSSIGLKHETEKQDPSIDLKKDETEKQHPSIDLKKDKTEKQDSSIGPKKHETEQQDPSIDPKIDENEIQDPSIDLTKYKTEKKNPSIDLKKDDPSIGLKKNKTKKQDPSIDIIKRETETHDQSFEFFKIIDKVGSSGHTFKLLHYVFCASFLCFIFCPMFSSALPLRMDISTCTKGLPVSIPLHLFPGYDYTVSIGGHEVGACDMVASMTCFITHTFDGGYNFAENALTWNLTISQVSCDDFNVTVRITGQHNVQSTHLNILGCDTQKLDDGGPNPVNNVTIVPCKAGKPVIISLPLDNGNDYVIRTGDIDIGACDMMLSHTCFLKSRTYLGKFCFSGEGILWNLTVNEMLLNSIHVSVVETGTNPKHNVTFRIQKCKPPNMSETETVGNFNFAHGLFVLFCIIAAFALLICCAVRIFE
ncbi:uncharacterized protein LOC127837527 [Dreissena polymorpha]|uniref:Uncharacterized protein n=1 Tax=Dreissena polymorpha TaxID=45954 RepID=A0A9D4FIE0_DREPO|nr:uncharacterized protein LOC127837527 [Dreissena polymorpha]KAH3798541.1 hypothetical protein DPMN_152141 [Dreissena polymorpha]